MEENEKAVVSAVIIHLNAKTNSAFKPKAATTQKPILARLHEGYTVEDMLAVIDIKAAQWLHNETMERYLRPQTLFSGKFESYLQEAKRAQEKNSRQVTHNQGFLNSYELLN
jgi:uncharacterized phage protein (TIGR02220 family)